jgi:hypothetical protein
MRRATFMRKVQARIQGRIQQGTAACQPHDVYYWLVGTLRGNRMVDGPYGSESEARTVARDKFDEGRWKVVPLGTRDPQRAKQVLRHQLVTQQNVSIDNAMEPMRRPTNIRSID